LFDLSCQEDYSMDFGAVSLLQGFRSALTRLVLGSAALAAAAGLAPAQSGVLYSFKATGIDGNLPEAGLIFDSNGALFGTTTTGDVGAGNNGTVFKLKPPSAGQTLWTEKVLHSFTGAPGDGSDPVAGLIFDNNGALYGTTAGGGTNGGNGTVFKLMPLTPPATKWTETVLYSFMGGNDGRDPVAGLIFDSKGALYGTPQLGGTGICSTPPTKDICGTVFKLKPPVPPATNWTEKVLYSFQGGSDGYMPMAGLILNSNGALFGTTQLGGGSANSGTVFKLKPPVPPATTWTEKVLYSFKGGSDGAQPFAGLIFDSSGALYGTTGFGGGLPVPDAGTVFKLKPPVPPATNWTETVLKRFPGGFGLHEPRAGLIFDSKGALYGTTYEGGASNEGTVFKETP
jgi:uncharacterized repeat protein (TIGR03803 family)